MTLPLTGPRRPPLQRRQTLANEGGPAASISISIGISIVCPGEQDRVCLERSKVPW